MQFSPAYFRKELYLAFPMLNQAHWDDVPLEQALGRLRKAAGLSQAELARIYNPDNPDMNRQAIFNLENTPFTIKTLTRYGVLLAQRIQHHSRLYPKS